MWRGEEEVKCTPGTQHRNDEQYGRSKISACAVNALENCLIGKFILAENFEHSEK